MIDSPWSASAWGALFGCLNGFLSRYAIKKVLDRDDALFYSVFAAGFFWRLIFLAGSVWFLRDKKYIILLPFAGVLILVQFIFEAVPLKRHGIKDDT